MTIRKITIDNSVRYVPESKQTRETNQNTVKNISRPKKQTKKFSQNNKEFLKNISAEGFKYITN